MDKINKDVIDINLVDLADIPDSYGVEGQILKINNTGNGFIFGDAATAKTIKNKTILSTGWSAGTTYEEYVLNDVDIQADSLIDIIPDNDAANLNEIFYADIKPNVLVEIGQITIYATNTPLNDINITLIIQ